MQREILRGCGAFVLFASFAAKSIHLHLNLQLISTFNFDSKLRLKTYPLPPRCSFLNARVERPN